MVDLDIPTSDGTIGFLEIESASRDLASQGQPSAQEAVDFRVPEDAFAFSVEHHPDSAFAL